MKRIIWLLIGMAIVIIPTYLMLKPGKWNPGQEQDTPLTEAQKREKTMKLRLNIAMTAARDNIKCGYNRRGRHFIRPSQAVKTAIRNLMENQNKQKKDTTGKLPVITFVERRPTGPWQVVFNYDDEIKFVRIDGFGSQHTRSIVRKIIYCN